MSQLGGFKDITPPPACSEAIASFRAENPGVPIDVICMTPPPETTLLIQSPPCPSHVLCCIEISREPILLSDGTVGLKITFVVNVPLHLTIVGNGTVICEFNSFIKIFQQEILCPRNQNEKFQCKITQIQCNALFMNEQQIVVDVNVCKEIIVIPPEICPPIASFPPQCRRIFPPVS